MTGFIKLPRAITEREWYKDSTALSVYIDLFMRAVWESSVQKGVALERGQVITTLSEIAERFKISKSHARSTLDRIERTHDIARETNTKFSVVTVLAYDGAHTVRTPDSTPTAHAPHAERTPTLLYKEERIEEAEEPPAAAAIISEEFVVSVCESYNRICKSLPDIQPNIATLHRAHLIGAAKQVMGEMSFEELFALVEKSDFLCGRSGSFKASFDWILRPENLGKILSGAYAENYSKQEVKKRLPTAEDYKVSLYD